MYGVIAWHTPPSLYHSCPLSKSTNIPTFSLFSLFWTPHCLSLADTLLLTTSFNCSLRLTWRLHNVPCNNPMRLQKSQCDWAVRAENDVHKYLLRVHQTRDLVTIGVSGMLCSTVDRQQDLNRLLYFFRDPQSAIFPIFWDYYKSVTQFRNISLVTLWWVTRVNCKIQMANNKLRQRAFIGLKKNGEKMETTKHGF